MKNVKPRAHSAIGSLDAMLEVSDAVRRSMEATHDQIAAASAARRSIQSALQSATGTRIEVARVRFAKLIELL